MFIFVVKNTSYDVNYVRGLGVFDFFDLYEIVKDEYKKQQSKKKNH